MAGRDDGATDRESTIRRVAAERFPYPNDAEPGWVTLAAGAASLPNGDPAPDFAPADLAVIDTASGAIVMVAVVETEAVDDAAALERWLPASRLGPLFLFVPAAETPAADRLCHELGVRLAALRGWGLTIQEVSARPFAAPLIPAFLPEALRPARFRPIAAKIARPVRIPRPINLGDWLSLILLWAGITAMAEVLMVFVVNDIYFPTEGAEEAATIDEAFQIMTYMAAPVFGLVVAMLLYGPVRFRAGGPPAGDGPAWTGQGPLPWAWLGITTALTITVMIFPGLTGLAELREDNEGDLQINVTAFQFGWSLEYVDEDIDPSNIDELVLPVDKRVHFQITSRDVLHSFWVPAFRTKIDAVPGLTTELFVTPDRLGDPTIDSVFRVQCAELCGAAHAEMRIGVRVVEEADFSAWLAAKAAAPVRPQGEDIPADEATLVDTELAEWSIAVSPDTVDDGATRFEIANVGASVHELVVIRTDLDPEALPTSESKVDESQLEVIGATQLIDPGALDTISLRLPAGRYALICNIPGHYDLGMHTGFSVQ